MKYSKFFIASCVAALGFAGTVHAIHDGSTDYTTDICSYLDLHMECRAITDATLCNANEQCQFSQFDDLCWTVHYDPDNLAESDIEVALLATDDATLEYKATFDQCNYLYSNGTPMDCDNDPNCVASGHCAVTEDYTTNFYNTYCAAPTICDLLESQFECDAITDETSCDNTSHCEWDIDTCSTTVDPMAVMQSPDQLTQSVATTYMTCSQSTVNECENNDECKLTTGDECIPSDLVIASVAVDECGLTPYPPLTTVCEYAASLITCDAVTGETACDATESCYWDSDDASCASDLDYGVALLSQDAISQGVRQVINTCAQHADETSCNADDNCAYYTDGGFCGPSEAYERSVATACGLSLPVTLNVTIPVTFPPPPPANSGASPVTIATTLAAFAMPILI